MRNFEFERGRKNRRPRKYKSTSKTYLKTDKRTLEALSVCVYVCLSLSPRFIMLPACEILNLPDKEEASITKCAIFETIAITIPLELWFIKCLSTAKTKVESTIQLQIVQLQLMPIFVVVAGTKLQKSRKRGRSSMTLLRWYIAILIQIGFIYGL